MKITNILRVLGVIFLSLVIGSVSAESVSEKDVKQWWRWYFAIPAENHPFADSSWDVSPQATCEQGQFGNSWFLAGSDSFAAGTARDCTVPRYKTIVFPVINANCSTIEAAPFRGTFDPSRKTKKRHPSPTLTECVNAIGFSSADAVVVTLDGNPVVPTDIGVSDHFQFKVPDDNFIGVETAVEGNQGKARAGGYYGKIGPLMPGVYTLDIIGVLGDGPFVGFTQKVTYTLNVQ